MGASASAPRRVTVENEDTSGSIVMSESVYSRLKANLNGEESRESSSKDSSGSKEESVPSPQQQQPAPVPPPVPTALEEDYSQRRGPLVLPPGSSSSVPLVQYVQEPSLSAMKVKEAKEEELRELEVYYQKRLSDLRDEHDRIANISEDQFKASLDKVQSLFKVPLKGPICPQERQRVLECYEKYADKPLLCSQSVADFRNAVRASRLSSG
eukprot:TRINITY_DN3811_c0_g1_i1.p1 TRINITY_DN3811_c0_g1~~TRINITY_DN3811_c0_g1_i1.p1  ORF type:complete len:211 (-),score=80.38 TRINITY_DN3811_c0_g1_i1:582-1214(-)